MQLSSYYQVKSGNSTPLTSRTPALAAGPDRMYMVYTGQGDSNIWWAQSTNPEDPNSWTRNEQVKLNGRIAITSSEAPSIAFFQGTPVIAAVTPGLFVSLYYFDGNQWNTADTPASGASHLSAPVSIVINNVLHVFANADQQLMHLYRSVPCAQGSTVTVLNKNYGGFMPTAVAADNAGKIILSLAAAPPSNPANSPVSCVVIPPDPGFNWSTAVSHVIETADQAPLLTYRAAMGYGWGGVVGFVYLAQGKGTTLYSASCSNNDLYAPQNTALRLSATTEVLDSKGNPAKTQNQPALASFNGKYVCLAHQGSSNNNIYIGTTTY